MSEEHGPASLHSDGHKVANMGSTQPNITEELKGPLSPSSTVALMWIRKYALAILASMLIS